MDNTLSGYKALIWYGNPVNKDIEMIIEDEKAAFLMPPSIGRWTTGKRAKTRATKFSG